MAKDERKRDDISPRPTSRLKVRKRTSIARWALVAVAGALWAQTRDPLPVPDVSGYRTLKCDFHVHTVFSDGEVWPTTRISEAWRDGLDVIALTDHAGIHPHAADLRTDLRRPYETARADAERFGLVLIRGVEIAEGNLHCNALFVTEPNAFTGLKLLDALRIAKSQRAFVFWNHPGWKRKPEWFPQIAAAYAEHLFQGIELVNGLDFYPEVFPWVAGKNLTVLANSDIHQPATAEYRARTRPLTLVFARTADEAGVREALFAGRTAAWMGGQVWGAEEYLRGLWEGSTTVENAGVGFSGGARVATLRIRNRAAIPFRIRTVDTPAWLFAGGGEIAAESVYGITLALAPKAPPGVHHVTLQYEALNLHASPERNLTVRFPLTVEIH